MHMKGQTPYSFHREDFAISSSNKADRNLSTAAQHILLAAFPFHESRRLWKGETTPHWDSTGKHTSAKCFPCLAYAWLKRNVPNHTQACSDAHLEDQHNLKKKLS